MRPIGGNEWVASVDSGKPSPGKPGTGNLGELQSSAVEESNVDLTGDLMRLNKDWNLSATNRTGYSNTNSLQAEFEKRYSKGFLFQAFYAFSRSLTTTCAIALIRATLVPGNNLR